MLSAEIAGPLRSQYTAAELHLLHKRPQYIIYALAYHLLIIERFYNVRKMYML
jgi:hypothetical protein